MIFPPISFCQRSSFQWSRQSRKYGHSHPAPLNQINFLINVINDMIYVMDLLHLGECDKVPDFCRGKGLCLNTHNPRLTHCQCERGSFGRHCEFNGTNSWTLIILQSNQTTFNKISVRKLWIFFRMGGYVYYV